MATPSYRDLVRPAQIDASVLDSGNASAAQALARTLKDFERAGRQTLGELRQEQGRREGAEAGRTDDPAFRSGMSSLTAYGRAYNDAATRSYAIKSEIAADEAATRLEQEAGNDPEMFRQTFGARRDKTIKEAPPEARAVLGEVYDRRMAVSMNRIITAQAAEMKERDLADLSEGIARSTDRVAQLRASDDPVAAEQADEEELKLEMLIQGGQNDGTLSNTAAGIVRTQVSRSITAQTVLQRFEREMQDPRGSPIKFIERLKESNKTNEAMSPEEEEKLVDGLFSTLAEKLRLEQMRRALEGDEEEGRYAAGDREATGLLLSGQLTIGKLSQMNADDTLAPAVQRALRNELMEGGDRPDDARERFYVETTLLENTEEEIARNGRLSWDTRRELIGKHRELSATWRGSQQAREGAERIDRALGIVPGSLDAKTLSDDKKRQRERALTEWYDKVDALPPQERQAAAIVAAEEITERVIRGNTNAKLEAARRRLDKVKAEAGPVEDMGAQERKDFEADVAKREAMIRDLENKVK
jgi:hypothetical protein